MVDALSRTSIPPSAEQIAAAKASPSWDAICAAKNNCDMLADIADNNLTFLSHVSGST